ncbi:MAG TPA: hypothetical protein VKU02_04660 [Gemmataceae bacterium]|nr:hypothetical protein [Gemmataceae bacterium]
MSSTQQFRDAEAPPLADTPLWRLLVALHDVERATGPDSEYTHDLARIVQGRLRTAKDLIEPGGPDE